MAYAVKKSSTHSRNWLCSFLPSLLRCLAAVCSPSACFRVAIFVAKYCCNLINTVQHLDSILKLLERHKDRASLLTYRNLSHRAAVQTSTYTSNTKLHISNTTHAVQEGLRTLQTWSTSLQHRELHTSNNTQSTVQLRPIMTVTYIHI